MVLGSKNLASRSSQSSPASLLPFSPLRRLLLPFTFLSGGGAKEGAHGRWIHAGEERWGLRSGRGRVQPRGRRRRSAAISRVLAVKPYNQSPRSRLLLPHFPLPRSPAQQPPLPAPPALRGAPIPSSHRSSAAAEKRIDDGRLRRRANRCRGEGRQGGRRSGVVTGDADLRRLVGDSLPATVWRRKGEGRRDVLIYFSMAFSISMFLLNDHINLSAFCTCDFG